MIDLQDLEIHTTQSTSPFIAGLFVRECWFALYIAYFHSRPDAVVDPWLKEIWQKVLQIYPLPPGKEVISANIRSVEHYTEFCLGNRVS